MLDFNGYPRIKWLPLCGCSNLFLVCSSECTLALSDRQQSWIELDKCCVHSRVGGVATVAVSRHWNHLGDFAVIKAKEGPLAWKTRFVFYVHLESHGGALVVAFLVNRTLPFRAANFEHEHGFVGPGARLYKCLVRLRIYKDIVEHMMVAHLHRWAITHVESGSQVHPLPIVLGELELRVAGIFRTRIRGRRVLLEGAHGE